MTTDNWIQLAIAIPAVGTFLAGGLWGFIKVVNIINRILHEVTPNNGSSMNDRVYRLEETQKEQTKMLKAIKKHFGITLPPEDPQ